MSSPRPRYSFERGQMETSVEVNYGDSYEPDVRQKEVFVDGWLIFDKRLGHTDPVHIAFCAGADTAEKIVAALNAKERPAVTAS